MVLNFTKMHGLGNDFVVFDAINQVVELDADKLKLISDRRFGIGCDQILLVEAARNENTDFYYRIYNADGSEVEQCGNGARCFARFVRENGLTDKLRIPVGTAAGDIQLNILDDGNIRVDMGPARFEPALLPFDAKAADQYELDIDGSPISFSALSVGNPHAVITVDNTKNTAVEILGPKIENHPRFPQRVNVGFMAVRDREHIDLRVWERGAGETLACGTGACAAVVAGIRRGLLEQTVEVSLPGGKLMVSWAEGHSHIMMSGPATHVYEGSIQL